MADESVWATSPLGAVDSRIFCGGFFVVLFFFSPPGWIVLGDSKTPHRPAGERVSWCLETSPSQLPSRDGSPSPTLLSIFLILYFVLPLSEENGLPFWVPGILCQRSEVVLWNLLSVQMIF